MVVPYIPGMPGQRAAVNATPRLIFRSAQHDSYLPQGRMIDGLLARDTGNTGDLDQLRAGLLMGPVTSGGLYANSIIGLANAAYTAGGTSLTVTQAAATELTRRIGATGTFRIVGPPGANGIVAEEVVTYSLISSTTVTVTALLNSYISGAFLMPNDGSENFNSFLPDGYPLKVTDGDGTGLTVPFPLLPIAGVIDSSQLIFWPSDTSLRSWIVSELSKNGQGKWVFDHLY